MSVEVQSKKRKREESISDADGRPLPKQARSESPFRDAEDLALSPLDAHKVLTILETLDADGLLDRLIQHPVMPSTRTTFRQLLREPAGNPLRTIRMAVRQLLPSASHPRALISTGAANQQRFCDFAQSLFDQVAARGSSARTDAPFLTDGEEDAEKVLPLDERKRKYALVQRLPSGDWWSSATVPRDGDVGLTRAAAKMLATKQAELVSIIPSQPIPADEMPLFSSLKPTPVIKPRDESRKSITLPRKALPAPKLLDYGVFSTFAPYFDSENAEVGNDQIHQVVHESLQRRKARALRAKLLEKQKAIAEDDTVALPTPKSGADMTGVESAFSIMSVQPQFPTDEALQNLQNIIPQHEGEILKEAFAALRVEFGVSELLEHIALALDSIVSMQKERMKEGQLTPSDLEQEMADATMKSLSLLVSMQPRTSLAPDKSLAPSATVARALQRSLPTEPTSGWRGTLANNQTTSLRDDATMFVKATARAQAAATAAATVGHQMNGAPRIPTTPVAASPVTPSPIYNSSPYSPNPAMRYKYPPSQYGPLTYAPQSTPGAVGPPRVVPNMMNTKPNPPWIGYSHGPMAFQTMPPVTPVRGSSTQFKP
ncbi:SubName: Full=Uncharacterized protein {ECO:0000313/EMBL:CCA75231.1} [Serendipita indica DSM 11827]|uniref:Uncharacterized protein n=1 Tax=Serendipita indica (strain DSM 11827) TaxID=1109443 RepID=G4TV88_SERID|nr:SubName: Full=Uncharacterized protein {ECO:0000313/EMBL:CCA75231.1} [Serendipita indica DSM 11827]CCA75231.1 hypothetical protein PIIN_09215 [Serendipita indica DSM 11827]